MKTTLDYAKATVAEIVINDFRCVELFRHEQIDFYCNSNISFKKVCEQKNLDFDKTVAFFESINKLPLEIFLDYKNWEVEFIMQYIKKTHYKYIHKTLPELIEKTVKIAQLHGATHPELLELKDLAKALNDELIEHINAEEAILLPSINKLIKTNTKEALDKAEGILTNFNDEHTFVADTLNRMHTITNAYSAPADACKTYKITYVMLQHFEKHLQVHLHVENNILFPKLLEQYNKIAQGK